ncbi:response regulator [Cohnella sp. WQ 127256]|uniref:response regulator n=1 Tax=Cohnella sp. WQ 127256 TaxID=2938790 RepID=UPI002118A416|nr:response regulator [Cohnella sp. WQ 127256]
MLQLLLVDDEMSVVDTLAQTIHWEELGIGAVHKAYSALEAMNLLNIHQIDIVITDVGMPGMDGLELSRNIYLHWKHTKCLLLTAHADFDYAQTAIQNNICDYILKPISDQELITRVQTVVETIRVERESHSVVQRAKDTMREHIPRFRSELLYDLLQGKRITSEKLAEKINLLEVPIDIGEHVAMMLIRFKEQFSDYDPYEISLMEFAVGNMAEETFEECYHIWCCRDVHDYLAVVLIPKQLDSALIQPSEVLLNRLINQFQMNVQHYLKRNISVLFGHGGVFPNDLLRTYHNLLLLFRQRFGSEQDMPLFITDGGQMADISTLQRLYEPPVLLHLMEAGDWNAIAQKLEYIIEELEQRWAESPEHLMEAFFAVYAAFSNMAHTNGKKLIDLIDNDYLRAKELLPCKTVKHLSEWVWSVFNKFQLQAQSETHSARLSTVKEAQKYILSNLSYDISVQSIADHLRLHPSYLSRLYKLEMGENISDYITKLKLEKSIQLLKSSTKKVYEISIEVGYQNPHYFIKLFKKHYGTTPQEYRNSHV